MPRFDYVAIDRAGHQQSGGVTAASADDARHQLASRSWMVMHLMPAPANGNDTQAGGRGEPTARRALFARHLNAREVNLFTWQLATLASVVSVEEALRTVAAQSQKPHVRQIISGVHQSVLEGQRLADAMAGHPRSFSPLYRAMVAAGESSGALTVVLERLAGLLERQAVMRSKAQTALAYPAVLAGVATLVIIAMMVLVIPKLVEQFTSMGQTLPLLTRMVIGVSDALINFGPWLLAAGLVAGFGAVRALRSEGVRLKLDGWLLTLPFVGRILRDMHAARLARTMSIMLANGMPLLDGLSVTARTIGNRKMRQACVDMATSIREGGSISGALRRTALFPPLLVHMADSGEQSGRLSDMLARAAETLEREFEAFTTTVLGLLEPAIIVVMGGIVALIVLAILLPILQLNVLATG